jgi:hypothetical protein
LNCRNCGGDFSAERAAAGYDYCTRPECIEACMKPLNVVAVAVNKASDQYVQSKHLDLPQHPTRTAANEEWDGLGAMAARPQPSPARPKGTAERIRELEATLDAALATERDPERRRKLISDHNARLRRLNIRYRRTAQRQS